MKYLIPNGDDFGASEGINRGIVEAHESGILTSTSLMVDMPFAEAAAMLSHTLPALSVGLHLTFTNEAGDQVIDLDDAAQCQAEVCRQLTRFQELIGRPPTHPDSHHNIHRDRRLLPLCLDLARACGLPLREHSPVHYFSQFYGQWDGETHLEQISVENLARMLAIDIADGLTELGCHPGYVDPDFQSAYSIEREAELQTLCDPIVREILAEQQIQLIGFGDVGRIAVGAKS